MNTTETMMNTMTNVANEPMELNVRPVVQMLALPELEQQANTLAAPIAESLNPLHQIKTRLMVNVGEVELTVGELMNAKEHQIIRLDRKIEQPVDLLLEGKVVARGMLVAVDDNFAIKITELPISLKV